MTPARSLPMRLCAAVLNTGLLVAIGLPASCRQAPSTDQETVSADSAARAPLDGIGNDSRGIPRYTKRQFSAAERKLLLNAFGIDEPGGLYLSDSSDGEVVKFDTKAKRCRICYVDSYRVGFLSLRLPRETWEEFELGISGKHVKDFPPAAGAADRSLDHLDAEARPAFTMLIADAQRAGFRLTIVETYRSPQRETLLFALGHGRTYTATSMHTYGRAVDFSVRDLRTGRTAPRTEWVRFRKFVLANGGQFRIIGAVDRTWDWPHVELVSPTLGFHSIDQALAFAARCTTDSASAHAPTSAQLGGAAPDPCVFVPVLH